MARTKQRKVERMAGEELEKAQLRRAKKESLQTDDEARAERLENIKFKDGLTSLPDDYDDLVVAKVLSGSWGKEDLDRYNHRMREGGMPDPVDDDSVEVTIDEPIEDIDSDDGGPRVSFGNMEDSPMFSSSPTQSIVNSGDGTKVNQANNVNSFIAGDGNVSNTYQDNQISNSDGTKRMIFAKRDPMDFKRMFMQNLFN